MFTRGTRFWHTAISININRYQRSMGIGVVGSRSRRGFLSLSLWFPIYGHLPELCFKPRLAKGAPEMHRLRGFSSHQLRFFTSHCLPAHHTTTQTKNFKTTGTAQNGCHLCYPRGWTNLPTLKPIKNHQIFAVIYGSLVAWRDGTWDMRNPGGPHVTHLTMAFFRMALNGAYRKAEMSQFPKFPEKKHRPSLSRTY